MTFGILKLTSLMMGNQSADESNPSFDVYKKESERYQIPAIEEEKTTARIGQPLLSQRHKLRERERERVGIPYRFGGGPSKRRAARGGDKPKRKREKKNQHQDETRYFQGMRSYLLDGMQSRKERREERKTS